VKLLTSKMADACLEGRQIAMERGELAAAVPEEREFLETPRYDLIEEYLDDEEDYLPSVCASRSSAWSTPTATPTGSTT